MVALLNVFWIIAWLVIVVLWYHVTLTRRRQACYIALLEELLREPTDCWLNARAVAARAGIPLHAAYPALMHLEDDGLAEGREVVGGPHRGGRSVWLYRATPPRTP